MPLLRLIRTFGLLAVALLAMAANANPAPRVSATDIDNFAGAAPLPIGASTKVSNPAGATAEIGEPIDCSSDVFHSVWFTFTPVNNGLLYLSTAGTLLIDPLQSLDDTVLAVYTGATVGALTTVACNNDFGGPKSELSFAFVAGTTYHIQLRTETNTTFAASSFYKLSSRIVQLYLYPQNNSFEGPLTSADWTIKNGTVDDVVCGDVTYVAYNGVCTFMFTGSATESAKLTQTVSVPAGYKLRKNHMIYFLVFYRGMDAATIEKAKITVTLIYADGTPSTKYVVSLNGVPASPDYAAAVGIMPLASASLNKIKLQISHSSTAGTLLVDQFKMYYDGGTISRETLGALPAPTPPNGKS